MAVTANLVPAGRSRSPLDLERQDYIVRCLTCSLAVPVTGATAASILIGKHLGSSRVCPRLGVYADPVTTVEQLRQRVRTRVQEVARG